MSKKPSKSLAQELDSYITPFRYDGWLVVEAEQDPAKAHPLTYARMGFENLKRAAETAGFAIRPRQG